MRVFAAIELQIEDKTKELPNGLSIHFLFFGLFWRRINPTAAALYARYKSARCTTHFIEGRSKGGVGFIPTACRWMSDLPLLHFISLYPMLCLSSCEVSPFFQRKSLVSASQNKKEGLLHCTYAFSNAMKQRLRHWQLIGWHALGIWSRR